MTQTIDSTQKITPFLWFDGNVEEAIEYYTSIFKNSSVGNISRLNNGNNNEKGKIITATFQLEGQKFMILNGGPNFKFTPAISFFVKCKDQEEVNDLWKKLTKDGEESRCGWLKDKYGISWQIIPNDLARLLSGGGNETRSKLVMEAMLKMNKIIVKDLQEAYDGV